jgi:hypothetical protein
VSQGGFGGGGAGGFGPPGGNGGQFTRPNGGQFTPPNGGPFPGQGGQFTPPSGGQLPGGAGRVGGMGGNGTAGQIMSAVRTACTPLTNASTGGALPSAYDGQVYDCAGRADALRAAA